MAHQRPRQLLRILDKRLKLFPVVGVLGPRQTGKSTLIRELLPSKRKIKYISLDREENKSLALKQPTLFIQGLESKSVQTVCIDEVQKAPVLFDTIKAEVDERKTPGRFLLSGSTEFSKKTGIQDALTGRIGLLRLFPLNLSEISQFESQNPLTTYSKKNPKSAPKESSLLLVQQWLERGGMPGIFAIRDESNRDALFSSWIETTCTRDLALFKITKFDPDLATRILTETVKLEHPDRTAIARSVGKTPRQIEPYLQGFKSLFVLYEIDSYKTGVGKPIFIPFDAGVAHYLGATVERRLQIFFLNECYSQFSYSGEPKPDIFYYQTQRGSYIDFIVETKELKYAVKLCHQEAPDTYTLRAGDAFLNKHPDHEFILLSPRITITKISEKYWILPWFAIV